MNCKYAFVWWVLQGTALASILLAAGSLRAQESGGAPAGENREGLRFPGSPGGEAGEEGDLPVIAIPNAPLLEAVRFLAEQADMDVVVDPALRAGQPQPSGALAPWPMISFSSTNATAAEALHHVLEENNLVLRPDPNTGQMLVTEVPVDLDASSVEGFQPETETAREDPGDEVQDFFRVPSAPVTEVIRTLAELAEIDILFDPELVPDPNAQPPKTNALSTNALPELKFYDKTYKQALQAILKNENLVITPDPETEIARITRRPPPDQEPLLTEIIQLRYSNVTNITELLDKTKPEGSRTKISFDPRTSQLIVRAVESEMESITNLVERLDEPTRQVLIEAHLIETSKNPRSIKGVDWAGTLDAQRVTFGNGVTSGATISQNPGAATTTTLPSGRTVTGRESWSSQTTLNTTLGAGGLSANTARGLFPNTAFLNADGVSAVLSFLNTEADTRVLSTPRAVMLDNETARLEVSRAFPIFEITPGTENTPPTANVTYTNLGTILSVTPRIAANSNISLKVVPEVSNVDSVDRQLISGTENTANVYAVRKIETRVMIPSGNTLVMGGLISDTTTKNYSKVPLLGDIPGLGRLFRRDVNERNKANLLIFVTPTIVGENAFHATETDFLDQVPRANPELDDSLWERGKPHDWNGRK